MSWLRTGRQPLCNLISCRSLPRSSPSHLSPSRGFSADHHGPAKVNFWVDPLHPGNWKEEHFVLISLAGWGLLGFGVYKAFSRTSIKEEKVEAEAKVHH